MRLTKDILAGLFLIALGATAAVMSTSYGLGSLVKMGPGGFPFAVGVLVALLGLLQLGVAIPKASTGEMVRDFGMWRLLVLLAGVVVFALLIRPYGLIPAVVALVFISRLAGRGFRFGEAALTVVGLTAMAVAIFYFGLRMPLKLGPW